MSGPSLAERIVAVHKALRGMPHAFGGALALAYYAEPRTTVDIDLNVFVGPERLGAVARRLARAGVPTDDPDLATTVMRDGQVRIMWDRTALDLFFAYDRFHEAAGAARRWVPFAAIRIPILAPEHLIVCKVVYNRPKDWVDIASVAEAGTAVDVAEVLRWVGRLVGDGDPRYDRVAAVLCR